MNHYFLHNDGYFSLIETITKEEVFELTADFSKNLQQSVKNKSSSQICGMLKDEKQVQQWLKPLISSHLDAYSAAEKFIAKKQKDSQELQLRRKQLNALTIQIEISEKVAAVAEQLGGGKGKKALLSQQTASLISSRNSKDLNMDALVSPLWKALHPN